MATAQVIAEARKARGEANLAPRPKGAKRKTEANIQEDIAIYKERMGGSTFPELAAKYGQHLASIELAIKRGEKLAKKRGIDVEYVKIRINDLFNETLGALALDVQNQARNGQVIEEYDGDGNLLRRRVAKGISARTAGELTRSLARWADFVGLGSGSSEGGSGGGITMVQLNMPSDGANFGDKWQNVDEAAAMSRASSQVAEQAAIQTVDVTTLEPEQATSSPTLEPEPKRRGRPPGSKNKHRVTFLDAPQRN